MKGQISLEYATTYTWALLIMIVIVGSLIYYGSLETERHSKTICSIGPQFPCSDIFITKEGDIGMKFYNNIDENITMNVTLDDSVNACSIIPSNIGSGEEAAVFCSIGDEVFEGDIETINTKTKFTVANAVDENGDSVIFTVNGKIIINVEKELVNKNSICDEDNDGYWSDSTYCGGIDCADNDPDWVSPKCENDGDCTKPSAPYCTPIGDCYARCSDVIMMP